MLNANAWKAKALTELDAAVLHEKRRNTISLVAALSACLVIIFVLVAFMHSAPAADFTDISAAFRPDRTPLTGAASSESISFVDKIATPLTGAWTFIQENNRKSKPGQPVMISSGRALHYHFSGNFPASPIIFHIFSLPSPPASSPSSPSAPYPCPADEQFRPDCFGQYS